jgi:hypothetical protein
MTATITHNTGTTYNMSVATTFRDAVKAGMSALGISGSDVVYDSGNVVIFKISNGTGTYAPILIIATNLTETQVMLIVLQ